MKLNFLNRKKVPPHRNPDIGGAAIADQQNFQSVAGTLNPFVKIGDKIKIHSHSGQYVVDSLSNDGFDVRVFGKRVDHGKLIHCTWSDFRNWCKA